MSEKRCYVNYCSRRHYAVSRVDGTAARIGYGEASAIPRLRAASVMLEDDCETRRRRTYLASETETPPMQITPPAPHTHFTVAPSPFEGLGLSPAVITTADTAAHARETCSSYGPTSAALVIPPPHATNRRSLLKRHMHRPSTVQARCPRNAPLSPRFLVTLTPLPRQAGLDPPPTLRRRWKPAARCSARAWAWCASVVLHSASAPPPAPS